MQTAAPVLLRRDEIEWAKAPAWARVALERLVAVVDGVRRELAAEAPHGWMPAVDIHPRAWVRGTATVDGSSGVIERAGRHTFGVQLPAQVVAYEGPLLRGLLVHEFSHCFETIERFIDHVEEQRAPEGIPKLTLPSAADDHSDDLRHVDESEWFGPSVIAIPKRGELPLYALSEPFLLRWAEAGLPVDERPQQPYRIDAHFVLDRAVVNHALELLARRAARLEIDHSRR